jgi:hypothetical protein
MTFVVGQAAQEVVGVLEGSITRPSAAQPMDLGEHVVLRASLAGAARAGTPVDTVADLVLALYVD